MRIPLVPLHPTAWLTLLVLGHVTHARWLFWLGFALAIVYALTTWLAIKLTAKALATMQEAQYARR